MTRATIEFKWFQFNRNSKTLMIHYKFSENKELEFLDIQKMHLKDFDNLLNCYLWFKNNLILFYNEIDIDIPFENIDFIFNRWLKPMGINAYEK